MPPADATGVEGLLRELAPQVLGALVRRFGDFDDAEDAVQEALLAAAQHWPREGVPANPRAWLLQTAERRLVDVWRSEGSRRRREELVSREPPRGEVAARADTLGLLFMCCHPALTPA
ncbi:MAG TPA: sigma factor, partial [Gaiella sp.]|nr:sigma factor [Gaiella sp.]